DCYKSLNDLPVDALDRITVYLPPDVLLPLLPEIAAANAREVWFNPGSDRDDVIEQARELGIPVIQACSIVDIGRMPGEFGN
ncbi:MAG: CoA-binding protein, partial [Planctomycetaceae bacterium]|nr:CoA-binding protein [Planctomycetaceae bacterium]